MSTNSTRTFYGTSESGTNNNLLAINTSTAIAAVPYQLVMRNSKNDADETENVTLTTAEALQIINSVNNFIVNKTGVADTGVKSIYLHVTHES